MGPKRVIISGGGTGGHLYPALVLGAKLRELSPGTEVVYVGSHRETERRIMEQHGANFIPMRVEGLKGRGLRALPALFLLLAAFFRSFRLLRKLAPDLVVGAGGYSSGPVVLLASWMGTPTVILEQNAVPGFTNRVLARWVDRAVVAFPGTTGFFKGKAVCLGNPVREEFEKLGPKPWDGTLKVLVFGGSQGSRFLNELVTAALPLLAPVRDRVRLSHQTGLADLERVRASYSEHGFEAGLVEPYMTDMPARFGRADLLVCRAGATTIAEIIAARKAAVLIPFAGAAEGHQAKNAAELAAAGAAEVMSEAEASPGLLASRITYFLEHPEALREMEDRLLPLRREGAAGKIAGLCLSLAAERRRQEEKPA
jgi:UDP-N-acetylglucosamine--N-acetylmuramyl-(pentapeptide) pyrophosphoryl-undecaprenol N-acetylglucosamine transferase